MLPLWFWVMYLERELYKELEKDTDDDDIDYDFIPSGKDLLWGVALGIVIGLFPWFLCKFILGWDI